MKTIGPAVFILIAGILSYTNAQSEYEQAMRSECNKNGGPKAFETLTIAVINIKNSVIPVAREILETYYGSGNGTAAALTVYCDNVEDLNDALISLADAAIPCIESNDREIPGLRNYTASVLQFPCANRNLVEAVHNSTDQHCLISKLQAVGDCTRDFASGINATSTRSARHEEACSLIQTFQQCSVRVLAECEDKIFSTTLDSLYKSTNNYLPCENFTTSSKLQEASQPGVDNLL